jgi:hypothetical protein
VATIPWRFTYLCWNIPIIVHRNPVLKYDNTKHFLFRPEVLTEWLEAYEPNSAKPPAENSRPSAENGKPSAENSRTIPETSSETTTESTMKTTDGAPAKRKIRRGSREMSSSLPLVFEEERKETAVRATESLQERDSNPRSSGYGPDDLPLVHPAFDVADSVTPSDITPEKERLSFPDDASPRDVAEKFIEKYDLNDAQGAKIEDYVRAKGLGYVMDKDELASSEHRENAGRYFMAALRDDFKAAKIDRPGEAGEEAQAAAPGRAGSAGVASELRGTDLAVGDTQSGGERCLTPWNSTLLMTRRATPRSTTSWSANG